MMKAGDCEKRIPIHGDENPAACRKLRDIRVKKESPYMGTKTTQGVSCTALIALNSEKRIPIHGDENRYVRRI